jgi:protein TonB
MNMPARFHLALSAEALPENAFRPPTLASFRRPAAAPRATRLRIAGIAGAAAVYGALLLVYLLAPDSWIQAENHAPMIAVNIVEQQPPPDIVPPPPKLDLPPPVFVPAPVVPEIELSTPAPPAETITVPDVPAPAPTPGPLPAAGIADGTGASSAQMTYAARLLSHLNRYKRRIAPPGVKRGQVMVVSLAFSIDRAGRVLSWAVTKSSGIEAVDKEARGILERAQPLPPMPNELPQAQLDLILPLEFTLR